MIRFVFMLMVVGSIACGVEGPVGPQGPTGPAGPSGSQGPQGPSGFESHFECLAGQSGLTFSYGATTFAGGDTMTSCGISDSVSSYGSTWFWKSGTLQATERRCLVTYDIDASSGGSWGFATSGSVRGVRYFDTGSASDGITFTYAASNCL